MSDKCGSLTAGNVLPFIAFWGLVPRPDISR